MGEHIVVAIYARKSKETDKGESVINQVKSCKEYAEAFLANENIQYLIYIDEGFSAKDTDRPEFQKLLHDAKLKKFQILICYRLDRISRNISDFTGIIDLFEKNNIAFVSIRERFDTATPMGRAMMYISSVFAQLERETIGERIRDNFLKLARTGRWLGGKPPTGYCGSPVEYLDDNFKKKKMQQLRPIPQELALVKQLYRKYIELGSLNRLLNWSLENQIKSKYGNDFNLRSLRLILTNTVYVMADEKIYTWLLKEGIDIASAKAEFNGINGLFIYNKYNNQRNCSAKIRKKEEWIAVVGSHPGVISSNDWIHVQEMLRRNSAKAPRSDTGEYGLITSLLRCACGSGMKITFKYTNGRVRHYYYKCKMKEASRGSRCQGTNLNGAEADALIIKEIQKLQAHPEEVYSLLAEKNSGLEKSTTQFNGKRELFEKELTECRAAIQNLTVQLSQNHNSTAAKYMINQIEVLDQRMKEIEHQLKLIKTPNISSLEKQSLEIIYSLASQSNDFFHKLTITEKRRILKAIIKEIQWDGENLKIFFK